MVRIKMHFRVTFMFPCFCCRGSPRFYIVHWLKLHRNLSLCTCSCVLSFALHHFWTACRFDVTRGVELPVHFCRVELVRRGNIIRGVPQDISAPSVWSGIPPGARLDTLGVFSHNWKQNLPWFLGAGSGRVGGPPDLIGLQIFSPLPQDVSWGLLWG
jgi:hypothetical protein